MALPNITPIMYDLRLPDFAQPTRQSNGFADMLRTLSTLQTMQYRAARNAAGGTGMPGNVEGDYMLMPDGSLKFVPGKTAEMRKLNLATMQSMELDNMLKADGPLQEKLRQLETSANTMSYDKQSELLEGARSDVRRIAEANKVDPQTLLNRAIKPYSDKLSQLSQDIARDDGLSAILDSAKISGKRLWNTIKQVGALGDSEAKLRLGENTNAYAQKITDENAYLRDQQLRAQEGQGVLERMSGPTGSALANIASGAIDTGIQFAPALAATAFSGPAAIGAWAGAGGWGALTGLQEQAERISGTQLSDADKVQAMDNAAEQAALVGAVSNLPFSFGPAARTARHLWGNAAKDTLEARGRTLGNYLKKDLPLTAAENVTADVGATVGQNLVFDAATGIATPTLEGAGDAVVGSLGASIPFALFPWMRRPRVETPVPTVPSNADQQDIPPTAPSTGGVVKGPAPKKNTAPVQFENSIFNETVPLIRADAHFESLWNDIRNPKKDSYDEVHDALVKFVLENQDQNRIQGVSPWSILANINEGAGIKNKQRPDTSVLGADDKINVNGRKFLTQFLNETETEEGWSNAVQKYRERGGIVPQSATVEKHGTEGQAGDNTANPDGNSGMEGSQPAPIEGAPDPALEEPVDGNRAVEVGGAGGSALQGERPAQTTEVPPSAEGGAPDAGTDAGRHVEGAGAAGGEPGPSAGSEAGEGVRGDGNAEPPADAGALVESLSPRIARIHDAHALNNHLDQATIDGKAADGIYTTDAYPLRADVESGINHIIQEYRSGNRDADWVNTSLARFETSADEGLAGAIQRYNARHARQQTGVPYLSIKHLEDVKAQLAAQRFGPSIESLEEAKALADSGVPLNRALDPADFERPANDPAPAPAAPNPAKKRPSTPHPKRVIVEDPAKKLMAPVRTIGDLRLRVAEYAESRNESNSPKFLKFYKSLVENQSKVENGLRGLIHTKLRQSGNFPQLKAQPHITRAVNQLMEYGITTAHIPDLVEFPAKYKLWSRAFADPADANPVDLYMSLLDKQNAQERTLNADGCKTV